MKKQNLPPKNKAKHAENLVINGIQIRLNFADKHSKDVLNSIESLLLQTCQING